jgi:hypothetical protein
MIAATRTTPLPALRTQMMDLAVDLARTDQKLQTFSDRGSRPTGDWKVELSGLASRIDDVRTSFSSYRPDAQALIYSMGQDERDVAETGGKLAIMVPHNMSFSGNWGSVLDQSIADVQQATSLLGDSPQPPTFPPNPPSGVPADAQRAADLVRQSIAQIQTVPTDDHGDASSKDARLAAYHLNMDAQQVLEQHFQGEDAAVTSQLRTADAHLEDANWQLAKKPSPDGRFNGVDIPGALRDSQAAVDLLDQLAHA